MEFYKVWLKLSDAWQIKIFCGILFNWLFGEYSAGMGALASLMAVDWLTKWGVLSKEAGGFWRAWKTDVISSRGMRSGIHKLVWYMAVLIAAHQLEQFKVLGFTVGNAATETMSAYLGIIEAKSILENLRDMGMKEAEPLIFLLGKKQKQLTRQLKE